MLWSPLFRTTSVEVEHGLQCFVHTPSFFRREMPDKIAEPADIDGTELFDKNPGSGPGYLDL
jgi:hypothetical protein